MNPNDRRESRLPVTGEVGSEGGSYADSLHQSATFSGPANPNVSPADAAAGNMPIDVHVGPLGGTEVGSAEDTASGIIRYPTEPPSPPDAREGRKVSGHPWRNGLIGVAAGTAALIGVSRLRRRRP